MFQYLFERAFDDGVYVGGDGLGSELECHERGLSTCVCASAKLMYFKYTRDAFIWRFGGLVLTDETSKMLRSAVGLNRRIARRLNQWKEDREGLRRDISDLKGRIIEASET